MLVWLSIILVLQYIHITDLVIILLSFEECFFIQDDRVRTLNVCVLCIFIVIVRTVIEYLPADETYLSDFEVAKA
jgi:hypothetical protein